MIDQGPFSPFHQQRWIEAKNNGSTTIPAFGICQILDSTRPDSSSAETPSGGRTVLSVQVPDSSTYLLTFAVNGAKPIAAGKTGEVTMHFPCYVAYDTANTPAYGEEWGPQASSSLALKNHPGLIILGDQNGTTVRVDRSNSLELIGKPDGAITKGSTGTVSVWFRNTSGTWADYTAYNLTCNALGAALTANKYVSMGYRSGQWLAACWES